MTTKSNLTEIETIAKTFEILRAVNRIETETFAAAIQPEVDPRVIELMANMILAFGAAEAGTNLETWLVGIETGLAAKAKTE